MSEEAEREGAPRRLSSRRSLSETTLPQEYLDKLEEKRKQLDESIHKYIAAKEREYKSFQKELKQQHKLSQGQNGSQDVVRQRASPNETREVEQSTQLDGQRISAADALLLNGERQEAPDRIAENRESSPNVQDKSAIAGLQDGRASAEREKDFLGLFTPDYLTALDAKDGPPPLQRSTSAPYIPTRQEAEPVTTSFSRANSDSSAQAKPKRPSHLAFVERTSSSGSSADGKLASAMRSPTQRPKQKRVSLAVGNSIVAPSDSVPSALSHNTTSSHSRKRSSMPERDFPLSVKRPVPVDELSESTVEQSPANPDLAVQVNATTPDASEPVLLPTAAIQQNLTRSPRSTPKQSVQLDPDGDLFDLHDEDEDAMPSPVDSEDSDNVLETENDVSGRIERADPPLTIPTSSGEVRYDPANGLIPEPKNEDDDSAVPYLAFGSSSAVAPTKPGFRRPSVIDDPVYVGANYDAAEEEAVENEVYGSSYNRPNTKNSFTPGSLGESYMARHAEEMMKMRMAQQQTQVKS